MSKIKLSYFDMDGGRGEPVRIALHMAGIEFEDDRISFPEFAAMREGTPLNAVPVIEIDGEVYTQSNAMLRYFGKQAGLYPDDPRQAFVCDEICGAMEDVLFYTVATFGMEGEELKQARAGLVDGIYQRTLRLLAKRLQASQADYLTGNALSIADLKSLMWLRNLRSGTLDHVPTDLLDKHAPELNAYLKRVENHSGVISYYASRNG